MAAPPELRPIDLNAVVTILDYKEYFRQLPDLSWLAKEPFPEKLVTYLRERPVLHG